MRNAAAESLSRAVPLIDQFGTNREPDEVIEPVRPRRGPAEVRGNVVVMSTPQGNFGGTIGTMGATGSAWHDGESAGGYGTTMGFGTTMQSVDEEAPMISPGPGFGDTGTSSIYDRGTVSAGGTVSVGKPAWAGPSSDFRVFEPSRADVSHAKRSKMKTHKKHLDQLVEEVDEFGATQAMETWGQKKTKNLVTRTRGQSKIGKTMGRASRQVRKDDGHREGQELVTDKSERVQQLMAEKKTRVAIEAEVYLQQGKFSVNDQKRSDFLAKRQEERKG